MPRVSDIAIFKQMKQPTLVIRTRTKVQELPQAIGASYCKITQYLQELGETVTDVPFVCYHNLDMQNLDVEIGFPVAKALSEKKDIKPDAIPEGYAVSCIYRGPYSQMEPVYNEITSWLEQNNYQAVGATYEYYYNGPGFPEDELLTKIVMPVKPK